MAAPSLSFLLGEEAHIFGQGIIIYHRLAFMIPFCYWLLLSSGDIEVNPGPAKYPCGICRRSVRVNQAGVQCDLCDFWVHKRCMIMPNYEYERLQLSDEPWCCPPVSKNLCPFTTVLPLAAVTVSAVCRNHLHHLKMAALTWLFPPTLVSFLSYILTAGAWYQSWTIYVFRLTHSTRAL